MILGEIVKDRWVLSDEFLKPSIYNRGISNGNIYGVSVLED